MHPTLAARKQRWLDFYSLEKPPRHLFKVWYMPDLQERPFPWLEKIPERIEWAWQKYCFQMELLEWLDDDALPYLEVFTGTEIFAAVFGCRVHYPSNDMPFALPLIHSAGEVAGLRLPGLDHPQIAPLFRIAEELRRRGGRDALLHMVDLQSPMDIAALIWEKTSFFPALLEAPEAVHELAGKVAAFQTLFLDEWFARFGSDFIAHYPDYYMPKGVTFSVDEIGAVSPRMFQEFFLPELVAFSERYGAIGIHCCANARHQWEGFKQLPNLRLLNINQPIDITLESMAYFAADCVQWPVVQGEGAFWSMDVPLPAGVRTVFDLGAASKDEALRLVEHYRPFCG